MPKIVDHEHRRLELANAAARVLSARGLENTTVRDVAREAGFSSGIVAHYFRDKDDMLAHTLRMLDERTARRFTPSLSNDASIQEILEEGMPLDDDRTVDARIRIQFWGRALSNEKLAEQQTTSFRAWIRASRALLRSRQRSGEIDEDRKVESLAEVFVALTLGVTVLAAFLPKRSRRALVRRVIHTATEALL